MNGLLRVLDGADSVYFLPDTRVASEVLNPALRNCEHFDLMAGYFSGAVLAEMAHGLASYLTRSTQPMRLLVSPVLSSEDQRALADGTDPTLIADSAIAAAFADECALQDALARHTLRCLSYLLAAGRLEMKVVIVREGIFHPKQWIFINGDDAAILSGSVNATRSAVTTNVEQLRLDLSWRNPDAEASCALMRKFFDDYWNNARTDVGVSIPISQAVSEEILNKYSEECPPTEADYRAALKQQGVVIPGEEICGESFQIPVGLEWSRGPYKHQGEAVRAWEDNGGRGVLAIATGGGKTISSLVAAHRLALREGRLFILVAAPTKPLVSQWAQEMQDFGLSPYVQSSRRRAQENAAKIDQRLASIERGLREVDSAVITIDLLNSDVMRRVLERYGDLILFIGDEAHNLGTERFIFDPPEVRFRLGLSATPERQYDPDGTAELFRYFGGVVYEFGLDRAIGLCLVPYDYYVHQASLNHDEMDEYRQLSAEIRALFARLGEAAKDNASVERKIFRRRAVLESAAGKISVLAAALAETQLAEVRHTLIYATDKNPEQLEQVNSLLRKLGIRFHQLTQEETQDAELVADIITRFRDGDLQVLTAKRVLDEGFNIPEISTAYVLASTTVERQWTQRRGRILRLCPTIGKAKAKLHDIVTMPPLDDGLDEDIQRLVRGELMRVDEFARLSSNKHARDGAYVWYQKASLEYRVWIDRGTDD